MKDIYRQGTEVNSWGTKQFYRWKTCRYEGASTSQVRDIYKWETQQVTDERHQRKRWETWQLTDKGHHVETLQLTELLSFTEQAPVYTVHMIHCFITWYIHTQKEWRQVPCNTVEPLMKDQTDEGLLLFWVNVFLKLYLFLVNGPLTKNHATFKPIVVHRVKLPVNFGWFWIFFLDLT